MAFRSFFGSILPALLLGAALLSARATAGICGSAPGYQGKNGCVLGEFCSPLSADVNAITVAMLYEAHSEFVVFDMSKRTKDSNKYKKQCTNIEGSNLARWSEVTGAPFKSIISGTGTFLRETFKDLENSVRVCQELWWFLDNRKALHWPVSNTDGICYAIDQKPRQVLCSRSYTSPIAWSRRGSDWEDVYVRHAVSLAGAQKSCELLKATLGFAPGFTSGDGATTTYDFNRYRWKRMWTGMVFDQDAAGTRTPRWLTGDAVDAKYAFDYSHDPGESQGNALQYDGGQERFKYDHTFPWAPFICTRQLKDLVVRFNDNGHLVGPCYYSRLCVVRLTLAEGDTLTVANTNGQVESLRISFSLTSPCFNYAAPPVVPQNSHWANLYAYHTFEAGVDCPITLDVTVQTPTSGYRNLQQTLPFSIIRPLNELTFDNTSGFGLPELWYVGAVWNGRLAIKSTPVIDPGDVVSFSAQFPAAFTSAWGGTDNRYRTFAVTAGAVGTHDFYFTISANRFQPKTALLPITILPKIAMSLSLAGSPAYVVVGDTVTVHVTGPLGSKIVEATTFEAAFECTGAASPTTVSFAKDVMNPAATFDLTPGAQDNSRNCRLTLTPTPMVPQFQASELLVLVRPKLDLSVSGLPAKITKGVGYVFTVTASGFYVGSVTVAAQCGDATLGAAVALSPTVLSATVAIAVSSLSTQTSCNLTLTTSGASATHFEDFSARRVEYSEKTEIAAEVNTTTPYVGEAILLSLSEPSQLTAGQTVSVTWSIAAGAGAATVAGATAGVLSLAFGQPTTNVTLTTATTGDLTVTFVVTTAPVTFQNTISGVTATVVPLLLPLVPSVLSGRISVGAAYARTVSVALPQLPWRGSVTVTAHFTASDISVTPTSKTWTSDDGANDAAVFTVTGKAPVNGTALWFNVTGTATDYNTSGLAAVHAATLDVYERATLGLDVVGKNTTYAVQGNTLTFRVTASHPLPLALPLVLSMPDRLVSSPPTTSSIAEWTNSTQLAVGPVPGVSTENFAVTVAIADGASAAAQAEVHPLAESLTVQLGVLTRHTVSVECDKVTLFFGPGNQLNCTLTASAFPAPSAGTVTLSGSDTTGAGVTITPQAAVLGASRTQQFLIAPDPAVDVISVEDGSSHTVTISLSDTSLQFDTQPAVVSYTASLLRRTTVALNDSIVVFVGVAVPVAVNLPGERTQPVEVAPPAASSLSFDPPSFTVPAGTAPASVTFQVTPSRPGDATASFTVTGEPTASTTSDPFTLTAASRLILSVTPSHPPVAGAGPFFLHQNITLTARLSATVPAGTTLTAALSLECVSAGGGSNTPGPAVLSQAALSFGDATDLTTELSAMFTTLPCRDGAASSAMVRVAAVLSGTAEVYSDPTASTAFSVESPVTVAFKTPAASLFGGSDRSATFLRLVVSSPPVGDSVLAATLTAVPPGVLQISESGVTAPLSTPLSASFASAILEEEHTAEWRLTAVSVAVPTTVTVTCVLSGTASTQFALAPSSVTFTVQPRLPVTVAGLAVSPVVSAATALGGHRGPENLLGTLTVSIAASPQPTGNASTHEDFADAVVVEPFVAHAPPGAAVFDPPSVTFTPGSATVKTMAVYAVRTTEANADAREAGAEPRIQFRTAGAAAQFVPLLSALPEFFVRFPPRSRVLVPEVARVLTSGGSDETFHLTLDRPATATVTVTITVEDAVSGYPPADVAALVLSTTTVQWAVGKTGTRAVTLMPGNVAATAALALRFAVAGPLDTDPVPSRPTALVTVITARTVAMTLPPFIYANGEAAFGAVRVRGLPLNGLQLEGTPVVDGPSEPVAAIPSIVKFDYNSPLQRQISVTAVRTTIPAGDYNTIAAAVVLNVFGTAAGQYDAPPPLPLDIRPRERIIVRGLPRFIYVGQSAQVTVRLSRPPECGNSPVTTVTPRFPTPDAVFSPASASWKLGANVTDYVVFTLTAMSASASVVPVFFDLSGDCLQHYTAVTDVDNTDGTSVLPPDSVALSFESSIVALVGGKSVASAYRNTTLTATVTVGEPTDAADGVQPPSHDGVSVLVEYLGRERSVALQDGGLVVFAPGEMSRMVRLDATLVSDTAALRLTVVGGASARRFASPAASAWPLLRVVRRIAATLEFDPTSALLVATRTKTIPVTVAQAPPIAMPLTVALAYGGLPTSPAPLLFPAASPKTTLSFVVTPPVPAPAHPMRLALSGPGAQAFEVSSLGVEVPVLPVQTVRLHIEESYVFVGAANARSVEVSLSQLPTLSNGEVTLAFAASPLIAFSATLLKLSAATPNASVSLTGVAPGTVDLPQFITASDTQGEYDSRPLVVGGAGSDKVTVRALHTATLVDYGGLMYTNGTAALTLRIPAAPSTGTVSLRPVLGNPAYPLTLTPPTVEFAAGATVLEKTITLAAPASETLPTTDLRIQASGTSQFAKIAAVTTLAVLAGGTIGLFDFPKVLVAGAANRKEFTVTFPGLPMGAHTLEFRPSSVGGRVVFSPPSVTLLSTSAEHLVNGIPTVRFSAETSDPGLTTAGSDSVDFTVTASDPTAAFNTLAVAQVQLFPLRSVAHQLDGTTAQAASSTSVLYVGSKATATLDFSLATGAVDGLSVTLRVLKQASGASQQLEDVPAAEVFVAAYTSVPTAGRVSFEITALKAGLSVTLRYGLNGAAAATVNTTQLPEPQVFFSPRQAITYMVPEAMYVGLESTITVTLGAAPQEGSLAISLGMPAELQGAETSRLWSAGDGQPLTWTVPLRPSTAGVWTVRVTPILTDTSMFAAEGGSYTIVVRPPTVIDIVGMQPSSFVAPNRQVVEVVLSAPLDSGESVLVQLHSTPTTGVTLSPSAEVELTSSGTGRQKFIVEASAPLTARFHVTFRSDTNRFVLGASANETTGPQCEFRPLKVPTVTPPPTLDFVVGQRASIQVSVAELPSPGHTLVASLRYFGSPANVQLPPAVQWTSSDSVTTRTLEVLGVSATESETLRVVFSKDTEYKLSYTEAELPAVEMRLVFRPKLNVEVRLPSSLFMKRDTAVPIVLSSASDLTLRVSSSPAGIIVVTPSDVVFQNGQVQATVTAHALTTHDDGPVTLTFAMVGGETVKFNPVPAAATTIIDSTTLLVKVPTPQMTLYVVSGYTVEVTMELGIPPNGTLTVRPTFECPGDASPFEMVPAARDFTVGALVQHTEIQHRGLLQAEPCTIQFGLEGDVGIFKPPSQLFTVTSRQPHNISLVNVPARVFVGEDNAAALSVALDTDSPLPLTEAITVTFSTSERCLSLSPSSVSWAVGNSAEPFVKSISVTATCTGDALSVSLEVTTTSRKFLITTPAQVAFDVRDPMSVAVTSEANAGGANVFYEMFIGSIPLQLTATLPEPLEPGETLTVRTEYGGFAGAISLPEGTFVGGGAGGLSRTLIIEAFSVAPVQELRFVVTGPPRYAPLATGGGLLEIVGPYYVTADFPTTLYEGQSVTEFILVQRRPELQGEVLIATPTWHGAASSLELTPPNATWVGGNPDQTQKPVTLKALEPSEGYTLEVPVSGSAATRYTPSAFNGVVNIVPLYTLTLRGLPRQLTVGNEYGLSVNIEQKPEQAGGSLILRLIPDNYYSQPCVVIEPDRLTFRADATAGEGVEQRVTVTARAKCPSRRIRAVVVDGKSTTLKRYKPSAVPHIFETVAWQPVALSWPVEAFAGEANAPEVLAQLRWAGGAPAAGAWLNVSIAAAPAGIVNPNSTAAVSWIEGSSPEVALRIYALENVSGAVQFDFVVTSSDLAVNGTVLPPVSMTFLPKVNLTRSALPPDMYSGVGNRLEVSLSLPGPLGQPQNTQPLEITVTPRASSPLVTFVPSLLRWTSGQRPLRPLFIEGTAEAANVSVWFDVGGSGARVLSGVPAPSVVSVLPRLRVTFTSPPSSLYVGDANSATVHLTAPEGVALTVQVIVDGEPTAIVTTPTMLRWEAHSPRTQSLNIRGVYATPLQCRIRYVITEGPPFVGMAVLDDVSLSLIKLLALRQVTRDPSTYHIRASELSKERLTFTPAIHVLCASSDPAIVVPRNAPNITDSSSSASSASHVTSSSSGNSQGNETGEATLPTGTVDLDLIAAGTVEITCVAVDTTFAAPASFLVTSAAKKRIDIEHTFTTFVNTTMATYVELSARPGAATLVVVPTLVGAAGSYVRINTPQLLFTTGNDRRQAISFTGVQATTTPVQVKLVYSGPVNEFRPPDPAEFSITVRPLVTATVAPSPRTVFKHSTLGTQQSTGVHEVYVGPSNGFVADVTISGPTLTGPLYLTPVLHSGFDGINIIPVPGSHVQFPAGTTTLMAQVTLARASPSPAGVVTTLALRPFNPPDEYQGRLDDIMVATVRFVALETFTISLATPFPETLFTGFANRQPLVIALSDFPGNDDVVSVGLSTPSYVRASPSVVDFNRPTPDRSDSLTKTVYIQGLYANPDPATVTLSWRALTTSSPAFVTTPVAPTITTRVSSLFRFDVKHQGVAKSSVQFFTGQPNAVYLTISVSGLPLDRFGTYKVNMTVDNATAVAISPSEVVFSKSMNNEAVEAKVEVHGVGSAFGQQGLRFSSYGPGEFVQGQFMTMTLDVMALRTFEIEGLPATIPMGIENRRQVRLRPRVASFVTLSVYTDCSQMAFSAVGSSAWVGTMEWQTYDIAATSTTSPTSPCTLYADIVGGADGQTYVPKQVNHEVHSVARPRVAFKDVVGVPLLEPAEIAAGTRRFTLQLSGAYRFAAAQLFDGTRQENATIAMWSSYTASQQPSGVQAALNANPNGIFREWSYNDARSELTARLGPVAGFATTSKEVVTIELRRAAIDGSVALDSGASSLTLQVNGKPATTVDSGAKSVISNGASAAVVAGGILSLGAATQAGKLQTIMDAFYCPNPDWKLDQESMDWTEAPIPISFGATDDLGVYAAVGFGNSLIIFGFLLIHLTVVSIIYKVRKHGAYTDKSFAVAMALGRFPSISLFPVLFFVQAIVAAGVRTVLYSPVSTFRIVAAVSLLLFGLGLPVGMYLRTGPGFTAVWISKTDDKDNATDSDEDEADPGQSAAVLSDSDMESAARGKKKRKEVVVDGSSFKKLFRIVFGESGHWEHPMDYYWTMRNGAFFDEFRKGFQWWQVLDVLIVVVIGVVEGVVPKTHSTCVVRNIINIFLFFLQFAITVIFRPYRSLFGNLFFGAANFLQFLSMLLVGIAFFLQDPDSTAFTFSTQVLLLFSFLLLVKAAIDAVFAFRDLSGIDKMLENNRAARFKKVTDEEEVRQVEEVTRQMAARLKQDTAKAAQRFDTTVPLRDGERSRIDNDARGAAKGSHRERGFLRPEDFMDSDDGHVRGRLTPQRRRDPARDPQRQASPRRSYAGHSRNTSREQIQGRSVVGPRRFVGQRRLVMDTDDL